MSEENKVIIVMGSETDRPTMQGASDALTQFGVSHVMKILSAHRTPQEVADFSLYARNAGVRVIIAGAGGAAHLPGMIASYTELPVIGVPVPVGSLQGQDALLSIVQMPKGVPVATVAIGNSWNAGILACQILGVGEPKVLDELKQYKAKMRQEVLKKT